MHARAAFCIYIVYILFPLYTKSYFITVFLLKNQHNFPSSASILLSTLMPCLLMLFAPFFHIFREILSLLEFDEILNLKYFIQNLKTLAKKPNQADEREL